MFSLSLYSCAVKRCRLIHKAPSFFKCTANVPKKQDTAFSVINFWTDLKYNAFNALDDACLSFNCRKWKHTEKYCVTSLEILTKNTKKREKLVKKVEMSRMTVYASLRWKSRGINNNICDQLRWRQIWWINHNVHESNDLTWLMTKEAGTSDVFGVTWRV